MAVEQSEIASSDQNLPIDNNCMGDGLHFKMPEGSGDYDDDGDESDMRHSNPTSCWQ